MRTFVRSMVLAGTLLGSMALMVAPAGANPTPNGTEALVSAPHRIRVYDSWYGNNCPRGYVCAHAAEQMQGSGVGFYYDDSNWNVGYLAYGNVARSAINKGYAGGYDDVIFYPCTNYSTCAGVPSYRLNNGNHVDWFPNNLRPESHRWVG